MAEGKKSFQAKALKVIVLSQLLIEANDDIKNSDMYKGKIKQFGKQYINQIGQAIRQADEVYKADPTIWTNLFKNIEELTEKLGKLDLKGLVMINQIQEHYKNHQEDWDNMFGVELEQLNS